MRFFLTFTLFVSLLAACAAPPMAKTPTQPIVETSSPQVTATADALYTFHTLTATDGTLLDYAVVLPNAYDPAKSYPVLLALPPGTQARDMVETTLDSVWAVEAKSRGWIVVSPIAPDGVMFIDDSARFIPELLNRIDADYKPEGGKVYLAGISNGGISAFRAAVDNPARIHAIVVLPGFPHPIEVVNKLSTIKDIPLAMFVGENDEWWVSRMQQAKAMLDGMGAKATLTVVPGEWHIIKSLTGAELFDLLESFRAAS